MKAADISDEAFLDAIRTVHHVRWNDNPQWIGASIWDVGAVLGGHPEWCGQPEATQDELAAFPDKVLRAKARRLIKRGLIKGCTCGCRGDFEIMGEFIEANADTASALWQRYG
jgi:hypothetical protein